MDNSLAVGVTNRISHLTQQSEPLVRGKLVTFSGQVMIESFCIRIGVAKQQRRAEFVLLVIQNRQDPRMVQCLDDLEFTSCRTLQLLTILFRGRQSDRVLPNPAVDCLILESDMLCQSILISRPISNQITQHIITNSP
jgi:hypothetical protein